MRKDIFQKYNILAKKSLGQNFLQDENILDAIAGVCDISGENIIEVGPGYGALSEKIFKQKPECYDLIELDRDMIDILEDRFHGELEKSKYNLWNKDILEYVPSFTSYSVIANIPYYITSPILRHFLYSNFQKPKDMCILMQKDVGDKILGKGKNKSSVLSLMIEKKCSVREEIFVPKESFYPTPKVESSVLYFEVHTIYDEVDDDMFLSCIKTGFSSPRKKLIKNLQSGGYNMSILEDIFCRQGWNTNIRGEDLGIYEWITLSKSIN